MNLYEKLEGEILGAIDRALRGNWFSDLSDSAQEAIHDELYAVLAQQTREIWPKICECGTRINLGDDYACEEATGMYFCKKCVESYDRLPSMAEEDKPKDHSHKRVLSITENGDGKYALRCDFGKAEAIGMMTAWVKYLTDELAKDIVNGKQD